MGLLGGKAPKGRKGVSLQLKHIRSHSNPSSSPISTHSTILLIRSLGCFFKNLGIRPDRVGHSIPRQEIGKKSLKSQTGLAYRGKAVASHRPRPQTRGENKVSRYPTRPAGPIALPSSVPREGQKLAMSKNWCVYSSLAARIKKGGRLGTLTRKRRASRATISRKGNFGGLEALYPLRTHYSQEAGQFPQKRRVGGHIETWFPPKGLEESWTMAKTGKTAKLGKEEAKKIPLMHPERWGEKKMPRCRQPPIGRKMFPQNKKKKKKKKKTHFRERKPP